MKIIKIMLLTMLATKSVIGMEGLDVVTEESPEKTLRISESAKRERLKAFIKDPQIIDTYNVKYPKGEESWPSLSDIEARNEAIRSKIMAAGIMAKYYKGEHDQVSAGVCALISKNLITRDKTFLPLLRLEAAEILEKSYQKNLNDDIADIYLSIAEDAALSPHPSERRVCLIIGNTLVARYKENFEEQRLIKALLPLAENVDLAEAEFLFENYRGKFDEKKIFEACRAFIEGPIQVSLFKTKISEFLAKYGFS